MKEVNNELDILIKKLNLNLENNLCEYHNFHVGQFVEKPGQSGCFQRENNWYIYQNDERNFCDIIGPFDLNAVIFACALQLYQAEKFDEYEFSEKDLSTYIYNHFHTLQQIDDFFNHNIGT